MLELGRSSCGRCDHELNHSLHKCEGCQGTIVYGATGEEVAKSANNWSILFGHSAALVNYVLPYIINSGWSSEIPLGWGFGEWAIFGVGAGLLWGYLIGTERAYAVHFLDVRTFHYV